MEERCNILILSGLVISVAVLLLIPRIAPLDHDVAGAINSARMFLESPEIFSSLNVMRFPVEDFVYGIAPLLSSLVGLEASAVFIVQIFLLTHISCFIACRILVRAGLMLSRSELVVSILGIYILSFIYPVWGRNLYGSREHLFFVMTFPYIMLAISRIGGSTPRRGLGIVVGLLALPGFCLKPVHGLAFVLIEFAFCLVIRKRIAFVRPEALIVGLGGAFYALMWLLMFREAFAKHENFVYSALGYYPETSIVLSRILDSIGPALILSVGWVYYHLRVRQHNGVRRKVSLFLILVLLVNVVVVFLQFRAYSHHLLPLYAYSFAFLILTWRSQYTLVLFVVFVFFGVHLWDKMKFQWLVYHHRRHTIRLVEPVIRGKTVGLISPHMFPMHVAILHSGARWHFPIRHTSYIHTEYKKFDSDDMNMQCRYMDSTEWSESSRYVQSLIKRVLRENPPDIVIADNSFQIPYWYIEIDHLEAMLRDPEFAELWKQYQLVLDHRTPEIDSLNFQIFERRHAKTKI